jgi:hypothetical protein
VEGDKQTLLKMHQVLGGCDLDQIVMVDECVFSQKSYKPMAWSCKYQNIT